MEASPLRFPLPDPISITRDHALALLEVLWVTVTALGVSEPLAAIGLIEQIELLENLLYGCEP